MPTYAPVSSTVVQTPSVLATLNDYMNETLIAQGYVEHEIYGLLFGAEPRGQMGIASLNPTVPIPSFRRPQRKTASGTQAEMILNFETAGNMTAFYDLSEYATGIYQGGTKIFTPWAHYRTAVAMSRTQKAENSGSGKQYDILKSQLEQNHRQALTTLNTHLLSTNTDINHNSAQHQVVGLRHWNSTSPSTGTQHGLDRSVYTPFRNNTTTISSFAATGIDDMDLFYYTTAGTNGNRPVDVIFMHNTPHSYLAKALRSAHRIVGSLDGADAVGKGTVPFRGVPTVWSPNWPTGRQDWLNTKDLYAFVLAGSDWAMETLPKRNNVAIAYEAEWFFACAVMHARPECNGVVTVSGA